MPNSRSVCQQSSFSSKTRRKLPSRYRFQRFKCLSSVRSLQDGGHPSSVRSSTAQRLARQDQSEGRVFRDPNLARSWEIPALCLEADYPRICMPSVRSCSSPPCIYEDHETSSVAFTPDRDSTDNLFGRHSPYECVRDRSPARHAYGSVLIREPRFCDQSREILFSANPAVRISRVSSEHSGYDSAPARLQSEFNQDALFNSTISTRCFSTGTISVDRQVDRLYLGCISRPFALSQFTTVETPSSLSGQELRFPDTTLSRGHRQTSMVASTSRYMERSSAPSPIPGSNNRDRRVSDGLGGCLSRHPNRGPVVSDGAEAQYQLSGAPGGIVCDPKLYEKSVVCSCAPTHGQYFCGGLSQPFRWDSFVGSLQSGSCSMGVGLDTQYLPQCRAHSGQSERFSRLGVAQFSGFKQLETLSGNFPFCNADPRPLHARPLCGSLELSTLQLKTGPNGVSHGCVSTELVNREELCVSPFLSNHALPCEAESGRGRVDSCHSSVANSGLVP